MRHEARPIGRGATLLLAAGVLVAALAGPAHASRRNHSDRCLPPGPQLTQDQIATAVDSALAASPGTVVRVAIETGIDAAHTRTPFLVVAIRSDSEGLHRYYFDGASAAEILPPEPVVSFDEAAESAVRAASPGGAAPQLLGGRLTNRVLNPIYVLRLVDERGRIVRVSVDALTGAVLAADDDRRRRGKGKGRRGKGKGRRSAGSDCDDDYDDDHDDDYDEDELDDLSEDRGHHDSDDDYDDSDDHDSDDDDSDDHDSDDDDPDDHLS